LATAASLSRYLAMALIVGYRRIKPPVLGLPTSPSPAGPYPRPLIAL
jgi:hypothetical protein